MRKKHIKRQRDAALNEVVALTKRLETAHAETLLVRDTANTAIGKRAHRIVELNTALAGATEDLKGCIAQNRLACERLEENGVTIRELKRDCDKCGELLIEASCLRCKQAQKIRKQQTVVRKLRKENRALSEALSYTKQKHDKVGKALTVAAKSLYILTY